LAAAINWVKYISEPADVSIQNPPRESSTV
jgi:hypothetical protein